jgi:hypothetical protein
MSAVATMPAPVEYPRLRISGTEYEFRYTRSSQLSLEKWGYELSPGAKIPALAWAAAMVGTVDSAGKYRSAGFRNETEFTDQIGLEDDLNPLYSAVADALKKAFPKANPTLVPSPGENSASTDLPPAS